MEKDYLLRIEFIRYFSGLLHNQYSLTSELLTPVTHTCILYVYYYKYIINKEEYLLVGNEKVTEFLVYLFFLFTIDSIFFSY